MIDIKTTKYNKFNLNPTFRYIVFEINPENTIKNFESFEVPAEAIYYAINNKVQQLHGDFGAAAIRNGFVGKYCNSKLRLALIRVRHGPHRFILSALPFIDKLNGKSIVINSLYVGATMNHCFKFLINYQKQEINKQLISLEGTPQYDELYKEFIALSVEKGICL